MRCQTCRGSDLFHNCGAGPEIDYEIASGAHEKWCAAYNGCPDCGSRPLWPWRRVFWIQLRWRVESLLPEWWWEWRARTIRQEADKETRP